MPSISSINYIALVFVCIGFLSSFLSWCGFYRLKQLHCKIHASNDQNNLLHVMYELANWRVFWSEHAIYWVAWAFDMRVLHTKLVFYQVELWFQFHYFVCACCMLLLMEYMPFLAWQVTLDSSFFMPYVPGFFDVVLHSSFLINFAYFIVTTVKQS